MSVSGESGLLKTKRLSAEELCRQVDESALKFRTTKDVEPLTGTIGQERALEALETGLGMTARGFNIFACGSVGTGRNSSILARVKERAKGEKVPNDWCYVNNFERPDEPVAIELPTGLGREFATDMDELIREVRREIPKAFEGAEYDKRKSEALEPVERKREKLLGDLEQRAQKLEHTVQVTPHGVVAIPVVKGEPLSAEDFEKLDGKKQDDLRAKSSRVQELVNETIRQMRMLGKEGAEEARLLDRQIALFAIEHLILRFVDKYRKHEQVVAHLKGIQEDIIENIEHFKGTEKKAPEIMGVEVPIRDVCEDYKVNVVVDNSRTEGAPVVEERNPTYYNLFGSLEYRAFMGGMTTDFSMVKAGAFHRANGGYVVLQVLDVLRNPFSWEGLKRTLRTGQLTIENPWEQYRPVPAATLKPQAIPVNVKVLLVGNQFLYQLLYSLDEDFPRLFKVKADFDVEMDFTEKHLEQYAAFVSARCQEYGLAPFDRSAVARLAQYGSRMAGHQRRLSTVFLPITDLIAESGETAKRAGAAEVSAKHVQDTIDARRRRSSMVEDKIQRYIDEGVLLIDTDEAVVGQVNGLAVYDMGDFAFGKPTRITCVTSVGRSGVLNIERESKMSGHIHDKGVMILTGYLASRFGQDKPVGLSASLCFEQSYSEVDGDSASCAELYALLSSLSGLALRQDIAVTGSVNQRGQVQPIGGVNFKIEGFFEVCKRRGLTGRQGVLMPARNRNDLMLEEEVVAAVREGKFHVWAVDDITEGIEIMTGVAAGAADANGRYPEKSVFGRADRRLRQMAEVLKEFGGGEGGGASATEDAETTENQ